MTLTMTWTLTRTLRSTATLDVDTTVDLDRELLGPPRRGFSLVCWVQVQRRRWSQTSTLPSRSTPWVDVEVKLNVCGTKVRSLDPRIFIQYSDSRLAGEMLSRAVSAGMCSAVSSPRASV